MEYLLSNTTIWVTISFIVFVVFAYSKAKAAILDLLDKQINNIKADIDSAENLRVEAQELLAQYQRKQKDAQKDAETIINNAKSYADDMHQNALAQTEEIIRIREEQLKERLKRIEEKALEDIRKQVTDLATTATLEILIQRLGKAENEKLINNTIKALPENIKKAS